MNKRFLFATAGMVLASMAVPIGSETANVLKDIPEPDPIKPPPSVRDIHEPSPIKPRKVRREEERRMRQAAARKK